MLADAFLQLWLEQHQVYLIVDSGAAVAVPPNWSGHHCKLWSEGHNN